MGAVDRRRPRVPVRLPDGLRGSAAEAGAGGGGTAAPGGDHRRGVPDPRLHERRALQRWALVLLLSLRRGRRAPAPLLRYSAASTLRGLGRRRRRGPARSRRVARRGEAPVQVRRGSSPGVHLSCVILRAGEGLIDQIMFLVEKIPCL